MCIFFTCSHERSLTRREGRLPLVFTRPGLDSVHAIESPEIQPCNLTNTIHPIFSKDNFMIGGPFYAILKPALQLASLFITEDFCLDWWYNIRYGQLRHAQDLLEVNSTPSFPWPHGRVIVPARFCGPQQRADLKQVLMRLAEHIKIGWGLTPGRNDFGRNIASETDPFYKAQEIRLDPGFMYFIKRGGYFAANPSQQARFQFFFALNLTHELAHAVFDLRDDTSRRRSEAFYLPDIEAGFSVGEMGASWERWMFGCKIQPISGRHGCEMGLMSFPQCSPRHFNPGQEVVYSGIPMDYVYEVLTEDIWHDVKQFGTRTLRCPETHVKWQI